MKKLKHILQKVEKHSPTILTCIGAGGVILTAVMSAKATPKAMLLIEMATDEKGEELTFLEKVKVTAPAYIPTALMAGSTITCIFGANVLNQKYQASLTSMYMFLDSSYKEYRSKVKELYGPEADMTVRNAVIRDHQHKKELEDSSLFKKELFYDELSERFFERSMEEVRDAEYQFNRMLAINGDVTLNIFYELLGLEVTPIGESIGWTINFPSEECSGWIDFYHDLVTAEDDDPDFREFYKLTISDDMMYHL